MVSKRGCVFRNARAENAHVEATLNHSFPAQVGLLHHLGLPLDDADAYGQTPLHLAALRGNLAVCEYLLVDAECEAPPRLAPEDRNGKTPADLARDKRHGHVLRFLEDRRPAFEQGLVAFAKSKLAPGACLAFFLGGSAPETMRWPWFAMVFNKVLAQALYVKLFLGAYASAPPPSTSRAAGAPGAAAARRRGARGRLLAVAYLRARGRHYGLIAAMAWFALFICFGLAMVAYHTRLLSKNLTTNEHVNFGRYDHFRDAEGRPTNPFDMGVCANVADRLLPPPVDAHPLVLEIARDADATAPPGVSRAVIDASRVGRPMGSRRGLPRAGFGARPGP
ncbi:protein-cysteine S-palmitoyltransferase [Aureococcus anophagefferens]|nr:protein-cysteine S-palmitoyltransferase [Aureococcus anophagefferens]